MKPDLVLLVCADPSVRADYERACGGGVVVLPVVRPGLSSVYAQLAVECRARGGGSAILGLIALHKRSREEFESIVLATFSAGYAFARALPAADRDMLAGLVELDSAHANLDPDGSAADDGPFGVAWLAGWAREAREGRKVLVIGHSDVDPVAYASTTKVAAEVIRLAGPPSDFFVVRDHNLFPPAEAKREHGAALTVWGPGMVAEAVALVRLQRGDTDTDPAPPGAWDDVLDGSEGLGLRALAWLGWAAAQGAREVAGRLRNDPRILAFSAACRRGGEFLGIGPDRLPRWLGGVPVPLAADEDPWCAALASATLLGAMRPGDVPPHGLRVSVRELCEDARASGALRLAASGYEPRPGDLAILTRDGHDPLKGGSGHVRRVLVLLPGGATYSAIGGNEANEIGIATHPTAAVIAWIAYS